MTVASASDGMPTESGHRNNAKTMAPPVKKSLHEIRRNMLNGERACAKTKACVLNKENEPSNDISTVADAAKSGAADTIAEGTKSAFSNAIPPSSNAAPASSSAAPLSSSAIPPSSNALSSSRAGKDAVGHKFSMCSEQRQYIEDVMQYDMWMQHPSTFSTSCSSSVHLTESTVEQRLAGGINVEIRGAKGLPPLGSDELLQVSLTFGDQLLQAFAVADQSGEYKLNVQSVWSYVEEACIEVTAVVLSKKAPRPILREIGNALLDIDYVAQGFDGDLSLCDEFGMVAGPVICVSMYPAVAVAVENNSSVAMAPIEKGAPNADHATSNHTTANHCATEHTTATNQPLDSDTLASLAKVAAGLVVPARTVPHAPEAAVVPCEMCLEVSRGTDFQPTAVDEVMELICTVEGNSFPIQSFAGATGAYHFNFSKVVAFGSTSPFQFSAVHKSVVGGQQQIAVVGCVQLDAKTAMQGFVGDLCLRGFRGRVTGVLEIALWPYELSRPESPQAINPCIDKLISKRVTVDSLPAAAEDVDPIVDDARTHRHFCRRILHCLGSGR